MSFKLALRDPSSLRHAYWYPVDHTSSVKEANLRVWFQGREECRDAKHVLEIELTELAKESYTGGQEWKGRGGALKMLRSLCLSQPGS